ncbi:MAG TPA: GntR family transcriptional regulator [Trueperaceae bacterium]|nr:GntR family transcriptional regulator [Trueperaceae bacterium]
MSDGRDFQSIYQQLRERIALLDYAPGGLLSENQLAKEFGVSRTPIRQVLQRLEFDGLVKVVRGVGTVVAPIDMLYLKQVYALRLKLIDVIADLDARWVSADEIRTLRTLHRAVLGMHKGGTPRDLARAYLLFNDTVTRAIGNEPLREIADRLYFQTSRVWPQALPALDWRQEVEIAAEEIETVAMALDEGNMPLLAETRRRHMIACIHRINHYLGSFEAGPESSRTLAEAGAQPTTQRREGGTT